MPHKSAISLVESYCIVSDEFDSDIGEDELDEELALPEVLRTISYEEKRELYRFKHAHNERDWEEEMLRRSDLLARKIDMERLKRMSSKGAAPVAPAASKGAAKKPEAKVSIYVCCKRRFSFAVVLVMLATSLRLSYITQITPAIPLLTLF
jgi:hypothetical protein